MFIYYKKYTPHEGRGRGGGGGGLIGEISRVLTRAAERILQIEQFARLVEVTSRVSKRAAERILEIAEFAAPATRVLPYVKPRVTHPALLSTEHACDHA